MVGVDHAGRVHLAGDQRPGGLALAADVVSVQPHAHIEASDLEVDAGLEARVGEMGEREERRLRRVDRADPDHPTPQVRDRRDVASQRG